MRHEGLCLTAASQLYRIAKEGTCQMERPNAKKNQQGCSNQIFDSVTGDEIWIYCYEPERKQQSDQWLFAGEVKPSKVMR